ncbi:hypothetical protein [Enterococcus mundtii]|uniref:Uncharacterized protein n=1 Tax=Enterococcus mundtii TaxID=53346 RepID=A0A2S7RQE8_ENTMU|nr:hypothetical protein [Enterococcus mundtii]PQF21814.1 hypothetical protein CUS89_12780 [Enterococcus mundtii]
MTFFPFVDSNRRPQAKIRKMTEELTQKFQAIDPDLTLIHNDNFIDYGPEVFPQLSSIYWDPRVPDHPMEHFVYSEYRLKGKFYTAYWVTPYGVIIDKSRLPDSHEKNLQKKVSSINDAILEVIRDYQVHNLLYWKDLFSQKQFAQHALALYKQNQQIIGDTNIWNSPFDFSDPKYRPLAAVKKNTEFLETQLRQLDFHLTLTHDDSFIDFGPEIGHLLADAPYDSEQDEPDDPIATISNYEYNIYFNQIPIYSLSPYSIGTCFHGDFFNGGITNVKYLGLNKVLDDAIEVIMRKYMLYNKYYWRETYTPEQFQHKIREDKEWWTLF